MQWPEFNVPLALLQLDSPYQVKIPEETGKEKPSSWTVVLGRVVKTASCG